MKSISIFFGLLATTVCLAQTTKNTTLNATANSTQTAAANNPLPTDKAATILFAAGKADLSAAAKESIKAFITQKMPYYEVSGYSDAHGDSLKNVLLSQNRAKAVADFLTAQGVDNQRIIVNYFGVSRAKNAKNPNDRKVEVLAFSKLLASWKEMEEKPQFFMITNKRDTVLTGKKGTIIKLPANCLSGDPTKPIKMVLKEFYGQYDMILNNMATVSDGKLLESSGMLFLAAEQNGKQLTATKPLTYQFPNQDKNGNTDYNLYKGVKTAGGVNWKLINLDRVNNTNFKSMCNMQMPSLNYGSKFAQSGSNPYALTNQNLGAINGYNRTNLDFKVNIGAIEMSLAECEGTQNGKSRVVEFGNTIYSWAYDRAAKFSVTCVEDEAMDMRDIIGLFYGYVNNRFTSRFFDGLDANSKITFFVNEDCILDNFKIENKNHYTDSILVATMQYWKKISYFKKNHKFKNKTISICLKDKELMCNEVYKQYGYLMQKQDSAMTVERKIQDSIRMVGDKKIIKEISAIENNSKDSINHDATKKFMELSTKKYFNYSAPIIGYINCDHPLSLADYAQVVKQEAQALAQSALNKLTLSKIVVKCSENAQIFIVFKNNKTMANAFYNKTQFETIGLPKNEPVYIIALTDKDGKAYMDIQETRVGSAPITMNTTLATPTKLKQMRTLLE